MSAPGSENVCRKNVLVFVHFGSFLELLDRYKRNVPYILDFPAPLWTVGGHTCRTTENAAPLRDGVFCAACQKSLAEFAACRRQKIQIIFSCDMCVRENTSQAASVKFVRRRRTNYARSRLQTLCRKNRRFFDSLNRKRRPLRDGVFCVCFVRRERKIT